MKSLAERKLSATDEKEKYMQKLSTALLDLAGRVKREWAVVQAELARGEADQLAGRR